MELKSAALYACVLVTVLVQGVGSSLFSRHHDKYQQGHNKSQHAAAPNAVAAATGEKSCKCRVELADGTLIKNFGKMVQYKPAEGASCHQLHHRCRVTCTGMLHLHEHLPDTTTTLGYHYCDVHGRTTTNLGVRLRAVWETTHCHQRKRQASRKVARLCCGHTSLPLTSDNHHVVAKVFGWNPDCRAQTFIVAS